MWKVRNRTHTNPFTLTLFQDSRDWVDVFISTGPTSKTWIGVHGTEDKKEALRLQIGGLSEVSRTLSRSYFSEPNTLSGVVCRYIAASSQLLMYSFLPCLFWTAARLHHAGQTSRAEILSAGLFISSAVPSTPAEWWGLIWTTPHSPQFGLV